MIARDLLTNPSREVECRVCGSRFFIGYPSDLDRCPSCGEADFRFIREDEV